MDIVDTFFKKRTSATSHETRKDGNVYVHVCYRTIQRAVEEMMKNKDSNYTIVETGCSAHGTKSTLLWDKIVQNHGGKVLSVDLNNDAVNITNKQTSDRTLVTCLNSLDYLPTLKDPIDLLYLDSYDVNFLNPKPSAEHHLKEFNCVKHLLHPGSIVLIDDTPVSPEWLDGGDKSPIYNEFKSKFNPDMTGKGSLVIKELERMNAVKIMHKYQVLYKWNS